MTITELYKKYQNADTPTIISNIDEIEQNLKQYTPSDLQGIEQHRMYIDVLRGYRLAIDNFLNRVGKNFKETIESLLSVGESGLYSGKLKWLFELIQNVDDCTYDDLSKCRLDIRFDTSNENNIIELSYNEMGFVPRDVFNITGIAEESKNILEDKIEIGEKGIGFKSVFGIAERVLIQSSMFSFELHSGKSLLPLANYENFNGCNGTKLTIWLKNKTARDIYNEIMQQYSRDDVLFTKNPILFLNKLTDINFYIDNSFRYLKLHVERPKSLSNDKIIEENINISVDIEDADRNWNKHDAISCYRYTEPIVYDNENYKSRYADTIGVTSRKHNLIAIIPSVNELSKFKRSNRRGALYSFLPTQIVLNMPLLVHAPYNLDASREYIDSQNENLWFKYTNERLSSFFAWLYCDLAKRVKERIVYYLPKENECYFDLEDPRASVLKKDCFYAKKLFGEALFYTIDNTYEKACDVISFRCEDYLIDPKKTYSLLSLKKKLFIPPSDVKISDYGVEVIAEPGKQLFSIAINNPLITREAFEILEGIKSSTKNANSDTDKRERLILYHEVLDEFHKASLTIEQVIEICKYEKTILKVFQEQAVKKIEKGMRPVFTVLSSAKILNDKNKRIIGDVLKDLDSQDKGINRLFQYNSLIECHYCVLPNIQNGTFFPCNNTLLLSQSEPLSAYANFADYFVKHTFTASLRLRQESEKLDDIVFDETIRNEDFLNLLFRVRKNIKDSLKDNLYNKYIQLINDSGSDDKRFIKELLQNADDCVYSGKDDRYFECKVTDTEISIFYNEDGFTKADVRAITAIGESTKKRILSSNSIPDSKIGEKGVGFKSVFNVANEVAVHSNGFHFKLTSKAPTIPYKIKSESYFPGTNMIFALKKPIDISLFTESNVLSLCLCLRNLKKITLGNYTVKISEGNDQRNIYINEKKYSFLKYEYSFFVDDDKALKERKHHQRIISISNAQKICLYKSINSNAKEIFWNERFLYSGLPTKIKIRIPLIIDAPFETTTSRENITGGEWNKYIERMVHEAIISFMHSIKSTQKNRIFMYINEVGIFDNDWLQKYCIQERYSQEKIVSLIDESFVMPKNDCYIYPKVCLYLFENKMVNLPNRNVVNYTYKYKKSLIWLGCNYSSMDDNMSVISEAVFKGHISEKEFRELLYDRLKRYTRTYYETNSKYRSWLINLNIVPVKPRTGSIPIFVKASEDIYLSSEENSPGDYYILYESLLSANWYQEIFNEKVSQMSIYELQGRYNEKLRLWLNDSNKQKTAKQLLNEYKTNLKMMELCKDLLINRIDTVPMLFNNGMFDSGNKYINKSNRVFGGSVINHLTVSSEYTEFAEYLGCGSIFDIDYDDIDVEIDCLEAEDIEDFIYDGDYEFIWKDKIIEGFILDEKIPYDLIVKYEFEWLVQREEIYDSYNPPNRPVKNIQKLREKIQNARLNRYISIRKEIAVREPEHLFSDEVKREYALEQYELDKNKAVYYCQMCHNPKFIRYIEVNAIEKKPVFAWQQMQLCLCLTCSKDFESLRNNEDILSDFIDELQDDFDITREEPIEIMINDKTLHFTATHLAEIQEILKRQSEYDADNVSTVALSLQAQKDKRGRLSEEVVFERLTEEYGKENVIWESGYANKADNSNGSDNKGYDISYTDNNAKYFVEVKTNSSVLPDIAFILTASERAFAKTHENYLIYVVTNPKADSQKIHTFSRDVILGRTDEKERYWVEFESSDEEVTP